MSEPDCRVRLRAFLRNAIPGVEFEDGDDIFALGYVNSLFALELVTFVESDFVITIENDDLELKNFGSIDAITAFVARKQSRPGSCETSASLPLPEAGPKRASGGLE